MTRTSKMNEACKERLFALRDPAYKAFQSRLLPTVPPDTVIGVRMPALRALARQMKKEGSAAEFLASLPHEYYEENNLHALLINEISDLGLCFSEVERFLPHVDNWATCDSLRPACFRLHKAELLGAVRGWLASAHAYTVRFGIEMLLVHFLDDCFDEGHLAAVTAVTGGEYYVDMMKAWYFATALAKQYGAALPYLEQERLDAWTHNKTIDKALESYRITAEQKAELKARRR